MILLFILLPGCVPWAWSPPLLAPGAATSTAAAAARPPEAVLQRIPFDGPAAETQSEISSLTWYEDHLILLPQYPRRTGGVFAIPKDEILAFLDGEIPGPLSPRRIGFDSAGLEHHIPGFEGYEALVFHGNQAFLAVEASPRMRMKSYLLRGHLWPDLRRLTLFPQSLTEVPLPVQINNHSNEALLIHDERLLAFFEGNGSGALPQPLARAFDLELNDLGPLEMAPLEYRLTDASAPDAQGRFWVSNFFFLGDINIIPRGDPLAEQFGQGATHAGGFAVERLVELQMPAAPGEAITFSGSPPVQISMELIPRNWEGLVRLDERGFLIVTDKLPETILAFIPFPPSDFP